MKSNGQNKTAKIFYHMIWVLLITSYVNPVYSQDSTEATEKPKAKPVKNTFESVWIIDNQTVMVPVPGTFEMDFQHRFGTWNNGYEDFFGLFASTNIRLGFSYVPIKKLFVGFGITKYKMTWDAYAKYVIFEQ